MSTAISAPHLRRRRPRPAMTPIRDPFKHRSAGTGRLELCEATSDDGTWYYERQMDQPGTPWWATHQPTGMVQTFGTIGAARAWTASPTALALLRAIALDDTRATTNARGRAKAVRALAILDGKLIPAGPEVDARCDCGGYLTWTPRGHVHVDVCAEELAGSTCTEQERHKHCPRPNPTQCDHEYCYRPNDINAGCQRGWDTCCGCCNDVTSC